MEALFEVIHIVGSQPEVVHKFRGYDYPRLQQFLDGAEGPPAKKKLYTPWISQKTLLEKFVKKQRRCMMVLDTTSWLRGDDDTHWMQRLPTSWANLFTDSDLTPELEENLNWEWTENEDDLAKYMNPTSMCAEDQHALVPSSSSSSSSSSSPEEEEDDEEDNEAKKQDPHQGSQGYAQ
eukprot:g44028.t1